MAAWNAQEESGADSDPQPAPTPEAPPAPAAAPPAPQAVAAEPDAGDPKNFRVSVKGRDEVTAKAIALIAHNPDMTIEEAVSRIKGQSEPTPQATPAAPAPSAGQTLAEIVARQDVLQEELLTAYAEMDFEKVGKLQVEGLDLAEKKLFASQDHKTAEAAAKAAAEADWDRYNDQAAGLYPDAATEGSALHAEMQSIFHAMEDAKDPLLDRPESTLRIAQMAALRLGVAPVTTQLVPPPTPSAVPAPKPGAPTRFVPMDGGTSHGTPASAALTAAATKAVERFTDEDWEKYNASMAPG